MPVKGRRRDMSRKTTDEEIRKTIEVFREMMNEQNGRGPVIRDGHLDFNDCTVRFDENGYTKY